MMTLLLAWLTALLLVLAFFTGAQRLDD